MIRRLTIGSLLPDVFDFPNWNLETGSSWTYYVNSPNYKINSNGEELEVDFLVAGVDKDDIEVYIEDSKLFVSTKKPGWNGNLSENIPLSTYNLDLANAKVSLLNGVLRVKFQKEEKFKKKDLEIK